MHAYNELLDHIDSFDFGMGDATADGTMYSVIYMNNEIPQLLVRKYYHKEYIVPNKIFGYDIEKHACIDSDVIFQTKNPPQIRPENYPESFGNLGLLKEHKGLVYTVSNRTTKETEKKQLLTWENNHLVIKDLIQIEYAELIGCEKLISYRIDDRKILE